MYLKTVYKYVNMTNNKYRTKSKSVNIENEYLIDISQDVTNITKISC